MTKANKVETQAQLKQLKDFDMKKSPYIRYLTAEGKSRKEIQKLFEEQGIKIKYQHIRNVQITPLVGKKD